jgi:hypothetical protein
MCNLDSLPRKKQAEELMVLAGDLLLNGDRFGWSLLFKASRHVNNQPESVFTLSAPNGDLTNAKVTITERSVTVPIDDHTNDETSA